MNRFLKYTVDETETLLFLKRPTALILLTIIAQRAKRTEDHPDKTLQVGEAFVGDWKNYCKTERCYRTDKKFLEKHQKATFISTNKGTIARIISTRPFDINGEKVTDKLTDNRRASDEQVTTNKNVKNVKNVKGGEVNPTDLQKIIDAFNITTDSHYKNFPTTNIEYWLTIYTVDEIVQAMKNIPRDPWLMEHGKPDLIFRRRSPTGDPVDRIGELLNAKTKTQKMIQGYKLQSLNAKST